MTFLHHCVLPISVTFGMFIRCNIEYCECLYTLLSNYLERRAQHEGVTGKFKWNEWNIHMATVSNLYDPHV